MKLFFTAAAAVLFVFSATAQKLNTKDFEVEAAYLRLPTKGLDPSITSYSVNMDGEESKLKGYGYSLLDIKKEINLDGFNRLDGNAGVIVEVYIGTPTNDKPELVTTDKLDKDKKVYKEYHYKQPIGITCTYKIMDSAGRILGENQIVRADEYKTPAFTSSSAAYKSYTDNYPKATIDAQSTMLGNAIADLKRSINIEYGLTPSRTKVSLESLSTKDHPDLAVFDKMKTTTMEAFAKMTPSDNTAFEAAIQPVVDFWVAQEKKYDPNNKDEKKMNFACRMNLAQLYFWMEDFDQALSMASKIEQGDASANQGKKFKEEINALKTHMAKIKRPTRHYKVEMTEADKAGQEAALAAREQAIASGDVTLFEGFKEKLSVGPSTLVHPSVLFKKGGAKQSGYLVFESATITPDFRMPGKIRFAYAKGSEIGAFTLDYETLDSIHIDTRRFTIQDVKLDAGLLSMTMKSALVEHVKPFNKTSLVVVYPSFLRSKLNPDEELEPGISIWHRERQAFLVPDGLTGFRKPLAKIVDACPAAVSFVESKQPAPKEEDPRLVGFADVSTIAEALRLYDSCQ